MKTKLIIVSAVAAALAMPVMAQTYGSGSGMSGSSNTGTSTTGSTGSMPPPGPKDTRDAYGKNTMCSAKDKMSDGMCKPGAKRVTDGSSGVETPSGASGPSNASGGGGGK